ncbi:hypothetical protein BCY91_05855 [Pelobium manganitolerans]|uniref:Uncharacterized protein n=1 Tax=Pelobium manganitolerans TaxID=1842495 RepID=A0A419S4K2_9SPHI|nr:DUF5522 domain-containing protein [Pelobium manganitolerans]RKD15052.1 hypothetical protein BCY91_05855 [Pelobium manganitolerans]
MQKNIDYYINDDGNYVFTEAYHLRRGFCCKNGCKHCPWRFAKSKTKNVNEQDNLDRNGN